MNTETDYQPYTTDFVHDEGLDRPSAVVEREKQLRNLIDNAELSSVQQQQLRQISAHYAVRVAPVPEENLRFRDRCLQEAIIQSDLPVYDGQAVENRGVSFDLAENSMVAVYVNDTKLTQAQLEDVYRLIPMPDHVDLEAVRIAFEQSKKVIEVAETPTLPEEGIHPALAQPAIEAPRTVKEELKPITAQAAKVTDKILQLVGVR
jgi:hypothetical protein